MLNNSLIPIILAGGTGTRLWPLSRESYPKQYLKLDDSSDLSLIQQTIKRVESILGIDKIYDPIVICNESHRFLVAEQMREINIKPTSLLLEPVSKNTAPAIALSTLCSRDIDSNANLIILSADHIIKDIDQFHNAIRKGLEYVENNKIVTFGVVPDNPDTGYGYIESQEEISLDTLDGGGITRFIEKPNIEKAKQFIKNKKFLWNSGMFMFNANTLISEMELYMPQMLNDIEMSYKNRVKDNDFCRPQANFFENCENISIDNAIMEKTNVGVVLPLSSGWNDIGNWSSLWKNNTKDADSNFIKGNVISKNNHGCYFNSESRLIAALGLEDIIVVETDDSVLVSHKDRSQEIKKIVNQLKAEERSEYKAHNKIFRPWGHYTSIEEGNRWQVKLIEIKPGATLSLQMHYHRAEHWIIVQGTAKVELDNKISYLTENEGIHIPLASRHRVSNPGKLTLLLIEVQVGPYTLEDDIVRFSDVYGRAEEEKSN